MISTLHARFNADSAYGEHTYFLSYNTNGIGSSVNFRGSIQYLRGITAVSFQRHINEINEHFHSLHMNRGVPLTTSHKDVWLNL